MMGELVHELKTVPAHQNMFKGVEAEALADFAIIAGDFNYMMNSTFEDFKSNLFNP
jgi:hypothetical protein